MELSIIRWIQGFSNSFLDKFFQYVTMLGEEVFVVIIVLAFYYMFNKKLGEQLAFVVFCSLLINTSIKDALHFPRPIGEPGIRSLRVDTAIGYSFPSGHAQTGSTIAFYLAGIKGSKAAYAIALIFGLLIGISRLYLGVHYPKDVLVGLALGFVIAYLFRNIFKNLRNPLSFYTLAILIFLPGVFFNHSEIYLQMYGFLCGFVPAIYLENRFVKFSTKGNFIKRLFRFLLGVALVVLVEYLCDFLPGALFYSFLKYFIISLVVVFIYPWFFKKINL